MPRLQLNTEKETRWFYIEPTREQYNSDCAFLVAQTLFKMRNSVSNYIDPDSLGISAVNPEHEVKKEYYTYDPKEYLTEIKVGALVSIERWDGNGTPPSAKVLKLKVSSTRCLVTTNMGSFIFSKDNCKKNDIEFRWNSENHKEYCSAYRCIDGTNLFIDIEV